MLTSNPARYSKNNQREIFASSLLLFVQRNRVLKQRNVTIVERRFGGIVQKFICFLVSIHHNRTPPFWCFIFMNSTSKSRHKTIYKSFKQKFLPRSNWIYSQSILTLRHVKSRAQKFIGLGLIHRWTPIPFCDNAQSHFGQSHILADKITTNWRHIRCSIKWFQRYH